MTLILRFNVCVSAVVMLSNGEYFDADLNEQNDLGLFEGDIVLTEAQRRFIYSGNITSYSALEGGNWPNGIIPYKIIDSSNSANNSNLKFKDFTEKQRELILEAMEHFHDSTCLRFVEKRMHHQYYIYIVNKLRKLKNKERWIEGGCHAHLGRDPTRRLKGQRVHLSKRCFIAWSGGKGGKYQYSIGT